MMRYVLDDELLMMPDSDYFILFLGVWLFFPRIWHRIKLCLFFFSNNHNESPPLLLEWWSFLMIGKGCTGGNLVVQGRALGELLDFFVAECVFLTAGLALVWIVMSMSSSPSRFVSFFGKHPGMNARPTSLLIQNSLARLWL